MGKRTISTVSCLVAIAMASGVRAQSESGKVAAILGAIEIERGGTSEPATVGAPVFSGDRLRTGASDQAKVVFQDDSVLDLAPDTEVLLAKQAFDRAGHRLESHLRMSKGKLRAWVGEGYREPRSRYEIETPTAITAVRGTEFIVAYDSAADVTTVVCLAGEVEVAGTLGVIGGQVQLSTQSRTEVAKGRFPTSAEPVTEAQLGQYVAGLELVGTGHRDGLSVEHPAIAGGLLNPQDMPGPAPATAPAATAGAAAQPVTLRGLQESLAERLSPDVRANTQPLFDFRATPPDQVPSGNVNVQF
jgi:hypothetical protein